MKKRSFRSTFVSVILVITVAISIVNLVFYPGNAECMTEEELNIEYISNSSYNFCVPC